MSIAIVTLSAEGLTIAHALSSSLQDATIYAHKTASVSTHSPPLKKGEIRTFDRIVDLTAALFRMYTGIVFIAPCGVAVRAIAPLAEHKCKDPAVVAMDVGGRHAISLLSGHEGGANRLAVEVANATRAEPVISTTTEAKKTIIVGVGCRKNTSKEEVIRAIRNVLEENSILFDDVRLLATADVKRHERGLYEAALVLEVPIRLIPSGQIRAFGGAFEQSDFIQQSVGLPAVAEPAAMLAGKNTELIVRKRKCNGITIAIARESCLWSA